jgi:hypothetical protein
MPLIAIDGTAATPGCFCCFLQRNISHRSTLFGHPAPAIGTAGAA